VRRQCRCLPRRPTQAERIAERITRGVDLGAQPISRPAQALGIRPPLFPCARQRHADAPARWSNRSSAIPDRLRAKEPPARHRERPSQSSDSNAVSPIDSCPAAPADHASGLGNPISLNRHYGLAHPPGAATRKAAAPHTALSLGTLPLWFGTSMSEAIEGIVSALARLRNREALEKLRDHRRWLLAELNKGRFEVRYQPRSPSHGERAGRD
jgi:hypothetical protein